MDCHMPYTTYGLQKAIRTHRIGNPSAKESHETGRPNACNLCHLDETLAWTQDRLAEWWGEKRVELSSDEAGVASGHLWLLAGDAGQRALAAWSAGRVAKPAAWSEDLAQLLDDPYESVRLIAWRSLRTRSELAGVGYDFVGSRAERLRAREAVLERTRGDARLDRAAFERLLSKRDDRRVDLSE